MGFRGSIGREGLLGKGVAVGCTLDLEGGWSSNLAETGSDESELLL